MLKKITFSEVSLDNINLKIEIRDIVYSSLDSLLLLDSKQYIKFIDINNNILTLKAKNSNVSQEIILIKSSLIKKISKKYNKEKIIDIKIKIGNF